MDSAKFRDNNFRNWPDIKDLVKWDIFQRKADYCFHAAAHKHVPLMSQSVTKNNV